jgi:hypothetical protein
MSILDLRNVVGDSSVKLGDPLINEIEYQKMVKFQDRSTENGDKSLSEISISNGANCVSIPKQSVRITIPVTE